MVSAALTSLRALVVVALVVVVGSVAFNVLAYLGAARYRRRHPPAWPLDDDERAPWAARALAWLAAFASECTVTAFLALSAPLALRRPRLCPLDDDDVRRPVVLLHGYAQHAANFAWLARRLRRDGWRHLYSVRHTPAWGDIERSATRLGDELDRILQHCGAAEIDIVAHSMGGLVARACLAARAGRGVARLITLGTPHQGTDAFRWLPHDPMVRQMRTASPLLRRLGTDDPVPGLVDCISIYSLADAVVVPPGNAYYPGAFNVEVRTLGHMSLLFSRRVYDLVRENLAAEPAARRESPEHRTPARSRALR
jgi:pimeloyl-ACP methyl ester carboxylesterase